MDEVVALRQQCKDILKRVPVLIGSASVQQVREFKKNHAAFLKLVDKTSATKASLQSLKNQLAALYGK